MVCAALMTRARLLLQACFEKGTIKNGCRESEPVLVWVGGA